MKIEVKERGSRAFYDEFLYVASNYKKIKKNPEKRVYRLTYSLISYEFILLLCIGLITSFYLKENDILFMFLIGMLSLLFVFVLMYAIMINKRIKAFMNDKGNKIVDINETGVEFLDDEKNIKIMWDNIDCIVVNKYSICFLPKDATNILISVNTDYKDDVEQGIDECGYSSFVVDNSDKYR